MAFLEVINELGWIGGGMSELVGKLMVGVRWGIERVDWLR